LPLLCIIICKEKTLFTRCTAYLNGVVEFRSIFRDHYFKNNRISSSELKRIFNVLTMNVLNVGTEFIFPGEYLEANPTRIHCSVVDFGVPVQFILMNVNFFTYRTAKHFWKFITSRVFNQSNRGKTADRWM
jgi:hypothetical protein